jgi:hypothetical protein
MTRPGGSDGSRWLVEEVMVRELHTGDVLWLDGEWGCVNELRPEPDQMGIAIFTNRHDLYARDDLVLRRIG